RLALLDLVKSEDAVTLTSEELSAAGIRREVLEPFQSRLRKGHGLYHVPLLIRDEIYYAKARASFVETFNPAPIVDFIRRVEGYIQDLDKAIVRYQLH
ncbi:MAG: hypothetical protein AABX98_04435, partial [Nanoarchaeota archaeon]